MSKSIRFVYSLLSCLALFLMLPMASAHSQSIGDIFKTAGETSWEPLVTLLVDGCFLGGFWLFVTGLMKARELGSGHHGGGSEIGTEVVLRLVCGSLLCGFATFVTADLGAFYGAQNPFGFDNGVSVGAPGDCTGSNATLTCVASNVSQNVVPIAISFTFGMFYLLGAWMVASTLWGLAKSRAHGSQGVPRGMMAKFALGGLIASAPDLIGAIQGTLGIGSGTIGNDGYVGNSSSALQYTATGSIQILQQYASLIGYLFQICVMFGIFAVFRGITIIRAHTDGSQQATMGAALTHIVGGILLANLKWTTCSVSSTILGNGSGFCN